MCRMWLSRRVQPDIHEWVDFWKSVFSFGGFEFCCFLALHCSGYCGDSTRLSCSSRVCQEDAKLCACSRGFTCMVFGMLTLSTMLIVGFLSGLLRGLGGHSPGVSSQYGYHHCTPFGFRRLHLQPQVLRQLQCTQQVHLEDLN